MKHALTLLLTITLVCLSQFCGAITLYEWEKDRAAYKLTPAEREMKELLLKQHHQFDYDLENGDFVMYYTFHRIVYVNNEESVQKHNKISISMYNTMELVELKARSINKNGKVVYFDKSNLKEIKDAETGQAYRVFAIEGIEIGSEVEYYFVRKMGGAIYDRSNLQTDVMLKESSFLLTCPAHLKFDFKTYNGLPDVVREEADDTKKTNRYHLEVKDVPAMKEESYSYYSASLKKVEFKLAYNIARSNARLYTWDEAAKSFYKVLYNMDKDEEKAIEKFAKSMKDNPSTDLAQRISSIEDKIKGEVKVDADRNSKELTSIVSIQKYKIASKEGITRLMLGVYNKLRINCKPLIGSNRQRQRFDGKFDTWNYLDEYAIYFPDTKGFVAPYHFEIRYPLIPSEWTAQEALYIDPISVGELKSALASVEQVPAPDFSLSFDNHQLDVKFNDDLQSNSIKLVRNFGGYYSTFVVPYYGLMNEDQRKQMVAEVIKQSAPDAQIKKWDTKIVKNQGASNFQVDADFQSTQFLETAGNRLLFKVGLLIGPQVEMYRDDTRSNPVENDYNRAYDRVIKVTLPAGYTVKNVQDIKLKVLYQDNQEVPFSFESDYTLNGNLLEIKVSEYYKRIYVPLNRYEDFRKVINAAADFNKITLVLEKNK